MQLSKTKWYSTKIIFQSYVYFVWKVYAAPAWNQCYTQQNSMTESTNKNFKSPHELRILFTRTWLTENLLQMDWFKRKSSAMPQKRTEFEIQSIWTGIHWFSMNWYLTQCSQDMASCHQLYGRCSIWFIQNHFNQMDAILMRLDLKGNLILRF